MTTTAFAVFDDDSRVVEPPALWEKYVEPEYRALGELDTHTVDHLPIRR